MALMVALRSSAIFLFFESTFSVYTYSLLSRLSQSTLALAFQNLPLQSRAGPVKDGLIVLHHGPALTLFGYRSYPLTRVLILTSSHRTPRINLTGSRNGPHRTLVAARART